MRTKEEWKNRLQGIQRALAAGDPDPLDIVCGELADLEEMASRPASMIQDLTPEPPNQPANIELVPLVPIVAEVSQASEQSESERTEGDVAGEVVVGDSPSI
jgi:hypothetical protein